MDRLAILENEQQWREIIKEHAAVARAMLEKVGNFISQLFK
jgi:hypothetical protein